MRLIRWLVVPALAVLIAAYWWTSLRRRVPHDVLLITVDTLRADHLGAYGWTPAKTPHIDRLAKTGLVFLQATTPMPRTTPGLASLLTGLEPRHHGSREVDQPIARVGLLSEALKHLGYTTIGVSANPAAGPKHGLAKGFDSFYVAEKPDSMDARSATDKAVELLNRSPRTAPLFLWVHYNDPHAPYDPPEAWRTGRDCARCDALAKLLTAPGWAAGHILANRDGVSSAALASCLDLYDGEIAYVDSEIGRLLEALGGRIDLSRALVVISADHGENFGEDGLFYDHGPSLHDASLRVPLIFSGPGVKPGRDEASAALQDIAPTILSLLRVPHDRLPATDGTDLTKRLRAGGREGPHDAERVMLAEGASSLHLHDFNWLLSGAAQTRHCVNVGNFSLCEDPDRTVRLFDHTLDPTLQHDVSAQYPSVRKELLHVAGIWAPESARVLAARSPAFKLLARPRPEGGYRYSLYDLTADPDEKVDVARAHPDVASKFREAIDLLAARVPPETRGRTDVDVELLRSLGYLR